LLLSLSGALSFRFAARQLCALLFHEPPRRTRRYDPNRTSLIDPGELKW